MYKSYLPQDLINIANDPGGGMILLGIKGEKKVYFWTVAFDAEDDYDAQCKTFAYVADSFNEFLGLLYPLE